MNHTTGGGGFGSAKVQFSNSFSMSFATGVARGVPFSVVAANSWRRTIASEKATVFKTPSAGDPNLADVVRRLVNAYRPERFYPFGSVARGDAGPDSDYDILVVVPDDALLER